MASNTGTTDEKHVFMLVGPQNPARDDFFHYISFLDDLVSHSRDSKTQPRRVPVHANCSADDVFSVHMGGFAVHHCFYG
ncbi:MAG: hypothetical protein EHM72_12350 [Calditrichaeota bacterium]|nr:MAG: hypothetical protein EHM72_12350 [Calditrichota bacterium]